jgi:(p)ppGpp synthase/HD superfamily hydrolase
VQLLAKNFLPSEESRKPVLFHDIRVGIYLYEKGYSSEVVLAGLLHDAIEWFGLSEQILQEKFGENIVRLIAANTKNDSIGDKNDKIDELIQRCAQSGQNALVVKAADIIDSFKWYFKQNNAGELDYCKRNADAILKFKPKDFDDKIFEELKIWQGKFS